MTQPSPDKHLVVRAHKIACELESEGYSAVDGCQILSMALGILMEGQPGSHRDLMPMTDTLLHAAQMTFDALRSSRERQPT